MLSINNVSVTSYVFVCDKYDFMCVYALCIIYAYMCNCVCVFALPYILAVKMNASICFLLHLVVSRKLNSPELHLIIQSVPRSKHTHSMLRKPVSYCCLGE
jgi:hypothetical protein